jgi:ribosomal protein S18 acetylase RimI-like enzyme
MDIAYIHVDTWQSAYRGMIPDEYLDNLSLATRGNNWLRVLTDPDNQSFVLVADNEHGEPVGFVEGGPQRNEQHPYKGELYAIYVLKEHQGKGIGRELLLATARELEKRGMPDMLLWVLKDNAPSRRFYESLGGQLLDEQTFELGGVTLTEVGYLWPDIRVLTSGK